MGTKNPTNQKPWALMDRLPSHFDLPEKVHWRIREFAVGTFRLALASIFGFLGLTLAHHFGISAPTWPFVVGTLVGFFLLAFFSPGDSMAGPQGLLFMLAGAYSLTTGDWSSAEWLRIAIASFGVVFGASIVFLGWLA